MSMLTLPIKREFFEQIKMGEKTHEFRLCNDYWRRRIVDRTYHHIVLTLGYPPTGAYSRRLVRAWCGYELRTITHPLFGADPVVVYAIDVSRSI